MSTWENAHARVCVHACVLRAYVRSRICARVRTHAARACAFVRAFIRAFVCLCVYNRLWCMANFILLPSSSIVNDNIKMMMTPSYLWSQLQVNRIVDLTRKAAGVYCTS